MAKKATTTIKVSTKVKTLIKFISLVSGSDISDVVNDAIVEYKRVNKGKMLRDIPVQKPSNSDDIANIAVEEDARLYIKKLSIQQIGGMIGAIDRIIITYQNAHPEWNTPDVLKLDWLDKKNTSWQNELA
jgi:hypothetical protein